MKPVRILVAMLLAVAVTTVALPAQAEQKTPWWRPYEARYLSAYERCWDRAKAECGRNIVDDGALKKGRVVTPRKADVVASRIRLNAIGKPTAAPPGGESIASAPSPTVAPAPASGGCSYPGVESESGGSWTVTNSSSGAYGCYQILPSTAAAHGCDLSSQDGQTACAETICATEGPGAWSSSGANPC